jgi:hypothetical protein
LDREAANAAKAVYDEAKARASAAGTAVAKLNQLRLMTIDDLQKETDAGKKETLSADIKAYEADIKAQEALKAAADKEVTRLKEAKDNSDKLAAIADEIAAAKAGTDEIVQNLQDAMTALFEGMDARTEAMDLLDEQIETYRFEADRETDTKEKARKEAVWAAAANNREAQETANKNDERLAKQYETQIRAVQNQYFITYAVLLAEKTNADLMVAIKQDMNAAEDISELTLKRDAESDATIAAGYTTRIEELTTFRT